MSNNTLSVLVVDDSPTVRDILCDALQQMGCDVHSCDTVETADDFLHNNRVDIMFLDIVLPGISGLDYIEKPQHKNKDLVTIVMTGYESVKTAVEAIDKGAYDYVIKPIHPEHMELIIKRALKRREINQKLKFSIAQQKEMIEAYTNKITESDKEILNLKKEINQLLQLHKEPTKYKV